MNTKDTRKKEDFDFTPFGKAIKKGRLRAGLTVDDLAEKTGLSSRYITAIENEGKRTSLKTLIDIITLLNISIDEIIYQTTPNKDSKRRYIESMLDELDNDSIQITEGLLKTLVEMKKEKKTEYK